jgi:hypothetical protein
MKTCVFTETCPNKTDYCLEAKMNLKAKPIVDGKFWIVENNGEKVGILHKKENNKFMLSSKDGEAYFSKKDELTKRFGKDFFIVSNKVKISHEEVRDVYEYPTSCRPYNPLFNVQRKLPLFTKSQASKSLYCAGYYTIKFDKGWVKSFCPKLITIERYPYKGPFKNEIEMKQVLANAKSD